MKWHRIHALIMRHLYLYKRSIPRLFDIIYWPILELLLWGFLSVYLAKENLVGFNAITVLLGAIIFWDLLSQSQRVVSISFLEEVWEKNFLNLFVTPLKLSEFVLASFILGLIRIFIVMIVMGSLAFLFYHFNILTFGFYLVPFVGSLLLFGAILGIFTTAIILRFGTSAQVLAFGFIILIQPFTAVFYPVSALPNFLQYLAYIFPTTYVFEGMRAVVSTGTLPINYLLASFGLNIIYMVLVGIFFAKMFKWVKMKGLLLKLDQ